MTELEGPRTGIVASIIALSAKNAGFVLFLVGVLSLLGWQALQKAPLDAIPDLSEVQVIVLTEWPGRSPDLVEDQVTYPLSASLSSAPAVQVVRGQSMFGVSFVYVIFEEGTDPYWARTRVSESLERARARLPAGVSPSLGPDASGVGWVLSYALVADKNAADLQSLRALQDWELRYALQAVPGVAEVASIGGFVKEYQVQVDAQQLAAYGIPLEMVVDAVRASNDEVGGRLIELGAHEHMIRGRGYLTSTAQLADAPVGMDRQGTPLRIGDLATVSVGPAERRGIAELNGEGEVVGGIVIMRSGENALDVIEGVKERLSQISLPPGVRIELTYDRSELVLGAIDTLRTTLMEEMVVVSLVIALFLLHFRSALVPVLTLPAAVLLAFLPMHLQGLGANIMSLGGIAVAVGAMVDASIILVENVHKRIASWEAQGSPGRDTESWPGEARQREMVAAMQEVGPSIFFSLLVITLSFLPVFALQATEGRLFSPLAYTKTWAMAGGALLAITLTPALVILLVKGHIRPEEDHPLHRFLVRVYTPVVRAVVRHRKITLVLTLGALVGTIPAALSLQSEFMPPLNEGDLLYMPAAPMGMPEGEAARVLQVMDREIKKIPEVKRVFGKMGRAETATDPAPLSMAETTIQLLPREQWRPGLTWEALIAELDAAVQIPGMPNLWWMPVQTRTEMLATGVRSPVAGLLLGDDLATLEAAALSVEALARSVPGTRSAVAERTNGGSYLDLHVNREAAARYGLSVRDVNAAIEASLGGMPAGEVFEGRARFPIQVRMDRSLRQDPDSIARIPINTPQNAQVSLGELANIGFSTGPPQIRSEDGQLATYVFVDPGEVPVGTWVEQAKARPLRLPPGTRLTWVGQYQAAERATERLTLVLPFTLALVVLLLWLNTRSWVETAIVLSAVPFSLIGAVWLLWILDYNTSVAVNVGMIALAGLDAETGVVMLLYLTLSYRSHLASGNLRTQADLEQAIVEGAAHRIRPKLMTVLTTFIGLVPLLWSEGTGADLMRRIAAPMIGGLASSFLLELLVYPALFAVWKGRRLPVA